MQQVKNDRLSRKLFLILGLIGFINIAFAYSFFYFSSVDLLVNRAGQQMESVRELTADNLKLYFLHLKDVAEQAEDADVNIIGQHADLKESLSSLYVRDLTAETSKRVYGNDQIPLGLRAKTKRFSFTPYNNERFLLKTQHEKKVFLWVFNFQGVNRILGERAGLGVTGEVYLVGNDRFIRGGSRHNVHKRAKVPKESIGPGLRKISGVQEVKDYRKMDVISAYAPFAFDELSFVLLSEIDRQEINEPLTAILPRIFILCTGFLLISLLLAWGAGRKILRMVDELTAKINSLHLKLITTNEEDKRQVSVNLHDGVGQIMTALKWGLSQKEDPEVLKELCDKAISEVRIVSDNLMPYDLIDLGLYSAIRNDFRKHQKFFGIEMSFWHSEKLPEYRFKEGLEVNLYRMVQELVQNTLKHAEATSISLILLIELDCFVLRYEDNGKGMSPTDPLPRVLQYRADLMNATIERTHGARGGLAYKISIPMENLFYVTVQNISS